MRIDLNGSIANQIAAERSRKTATDATHGTGGTEADKATFSASALSVAQLKSRALQTPEVRQEKVEALKAAIRRGDYKPHPRNSASAILAEYGK